MTILQVALKTHQSPLNKFRATSLDKLTCLAVASWLGRWLCERSCKKTATQKLINLWQCTHRGRPSLVAMRALNVQHLCVGKIWAIGSFQHCRHSRPRGTSARHSSVLRQQTRAIILWGRQLKNAVTEYRKAVADGSDAVCFMIATCFYERLNSKSCSSKSREKKEQLHRPSNMAKFWDKTLHIAFTWLECSLHVLIDLELHFTIYFQSEISAWLFNVCALPLL